jgi:hypothetical protein
MLHEQSLARRHEQATKRGHLATGQPGSPDAGNKQPLNAKVEEIGKEREEKRAVRHKNHETLCKRQMGHVLTLKS